MEASDARIFWVASDTFPICKARAHTKNENNAAWPQEVTEQLHRVLQAPCGNAPTAECWNLAQGISPCGREEGLSHQWIPGIRGDLKSDGVFPNIPLS